MAPSREHSVIDAIPVILTRKPGLLAEDTALVVSKAQAHLEADSERAVVEDVSSHRLLVSSSVEAPHILVGPRAGDRRGLLVALNLVWRGRQSRGLVPGFLLATMVRVVLARLVGLPHGTIVLEELGHSVREATLASLRVPVTRKHTLHAHALLVTVLGEHAQPRLHHVTCGEGVAASALLVHHGRHVVLAVHASPVEMFRDVVVVDLGGSCFAEWCCLEHLRLTETLVVRLHGAHALNRARCVVRSVPGVRPCLVPFVHSRDEIRLVLVEVPGLTQGLWLCLSFCINLPEHGIVAS